MRPYLVTKKSEWAHMSKHEQAWARMLNPLILTGLTSKSPILVLQMLIGHHESLFGDRKERVSTHEQAWASMSENAKSADFNRFSIKIPYFRPLNAFLTSSDPLWWKKEQVSTHEQVWASMSKNAKSADFNRFNVKIPYFGPPNAYWTSWDPIW